MYNADCPRKTLQTDTHASTSSLNEQRYAMINTCLQCFDTVGGGACLSFRGKQAVKRASGWLAVIQQLLCYERLKNSPLNYIN